MADHDTSQPILVLVRRGRNNRGFFVSPVEDVSNGAPCADEKEIGDVIVEMLDDKSQPRVNINELLAAAAGGPPPQDPDDEDEEYDEDDEDEDSEDEDEDDETPQGEGTIFEGVAGADDPADRLLFNIFSSVVTKGRSMSSSKVRASGKKKKKKKKKKK